MDDRLTATDFDVIIVGAGMVGAAMALSLSGKGLRIGLMDAAVFLPRSDLVPGDVPRFDSRVSAIAPSSRDFLDQLGCWDLISGIRVSPYTDMRVWDQDGTGEVHFSAADIHSNELGHIIENSVILGAIHDCLRNSGEVSMIMPARMASVEYRGQGLESVIEIRTESDDRYSCQLLLGADGATSQVRELIGFKIREWNYGQTALVTTVKTELPHLATAWQRFMPSGPLAFLPLCPAPHSQDQHFSSIVWSIDSELAQSLLAQDDRNFCLTLQRSLEGRLGHIEACDERSAFPLWQRHAVEYVAKAVVLIGDAAHSIHPLAGQGVNLGLADARVMAEEISANLRRGRPVNDPVMLNRYQRRRMGHNLGMMWMMEGLKSLFAQQSLPARWIRNAGMRSVNGNTLIRSRLIRQATGY